MPHSLDPNRVPEVIETIKSSDKFSRLTPWEMDFLESVEWQSRVGELSERQMEILEQIHLKT